MLRAAGALGRSFVWGAKRPWLGGIVAMGKRRGSDLPVEEHEERTGLPVIAILGQPNVGKSTLFNCFVRLFSGKFKNSSIVTNIPGTTRDRIYAFLEVPAEDRTHITRFMVGEPPAGLNQGTDTLYSSLILVVSVPRPPESLMPTMP